MERKIVKLEVYVELDPVPGTFHTIESAQEGIQNILIHHIEHYHPYVSIPLDQK